MNERAGDNPRLWKVLSHYIEKYGLSDEARAELVGSLRNDHAEGLEDCGGQPALRDPANAHDHFDRET